jgi:peptidoglycan L-alanyl-D-glutamate endopeptidase CwlK
MNTLQLDSTGPGVVKLQKRLAKLGFPPGALDGEFGTATEAAVLAFQRSRGLFDDGVAGPRTLTALGLLEDDSLPSAIPGVTVQAVSPMFPATPVANIRANLPPVLDGLIEFQLVDKPMVLVALATIRAETESFRPVGEGCSRFNTSPGGHDFDLYDKRADIGNRGKPDGARYCGRGYVQLTGRDNYVRYGKQLKIKLAENPELANDPAVAGKILAAFLKDKERIIKRALLENDLKAARRAVNGGSHGLDRFSDAYRIGAARIA